MEIEHQVSALTYSKRLEELGVKQESVFYWQMLHGAGDNKDKGLWTVLYRAELYAKENYETYSAFTVAELGEMLKPVKYFITEFYNNEIILYGNQEDDISCSEEYGCADTEATARAKMLIYLLEKGVVS